MVYKQTNRTLREPIMDMSFYILVALFLLTTYQLMNNRWK